MENYGFAVVAIAFFGVAWWLTRLMSATGRNEDKTRGGAGGGGFGV